MSIIDKILRKKEEDKKRSGENVRKVAAAKSGAAKSAPAKKAKAPAKKRGAKAVAVPIAAGTIETGILVGPHITEKTAGTGDIPLYGFRVARHANKTQIRRAVAGKYGVKVLMVRVMNAPEKERRKGRQIGYRRGFKKAIVTLAKGESIQFE